MYFCALEALHNTAKHADASRASVRLSESNAELRFEVTDNGQGFDPSTMQQGTACRAWPAGATHSAATSTSIQVPARAPGSCESKTHGRSHQCAVASPLARRLPRRTQTG